MSQFAAGEQKPPSGGSSRSLPIDPAALFASGERIGNAWPI
jgi:hypothetical protein